MLEVVVVLLGLSAVGRLLELAGDPPPLPLDVAALLDEELVGGPLEAELLDEEESASSHSSGAEDAATGPVEEDDGDQGAVGGGAPGDSPAGAPCA